MVLATEKLAADKTHPGVIREQDAAGSLLFDVPLILMDELNESGEFLPKSSTVIQVVKEEIGVLPERVERMIASTMNFNPVGPEI